MTAVEWFYQRILAKDIKEVFKQAKEMEKEQIMEAYNKRGYDMESFDDSPEEYYNNTYKK